MSGTTKKRLRKIYFHLGLNRTDDMKASYKRNEWRHLKKTYTAMSSSDKASYMDQYREVLA
tara:strand:+ start:532 stop:714 length:183 start_codon:yes stop_codon:yes gene_type:complete